MIHLSRRLTYILYILSLSDFVCALSFFYKKEIILDIYLLTHVLSALYALMFTISIFFQVDHLLGGDYPVNASELSILKIILEWLESAQGASGKVSFGFQILHSDLMSLVAHLLIC